MIRALLWATYGLKEKEQLALPISTYHSLFEQAFNLKHLDLGDGKYELQTQKDLIDNYKAVFEGK